MSAVKEEPGVLAKAGNFLNNNKWKIASGIGVAAAAAAAYMYREEIAGFATGLISGDNAGGDAFM